MKKGILKVFSSVLALCLAFGISGCGLFDFSNEEEQSQTGTPEENAIFATMKEDISSIAEYKSSLTVNIETTANMAMKDQTGTVLQSGVSSSSQVRSVDYVNKKGYSSLSSSGTMGSQSQTITQEQKLFLENGKYYQYSLSQEGESSYSEVSIEEVNEKFSLSSFETIDLHIVDSEIGKYILADNFDELKKAHIDVYKESVENQKKTLQKINDNLDKQLSHLNPSSAEYEQALKEIEENKRDINSVKADISLTVHEENGTSILKIVSDMSTDSIMSMHSISTLKQETIIKTKDGKVLEYIVKMDATVGLPEGTQVVSMLQNVSYNYSFDEKGYNDIQTDLPAEQEIKKPSDNDLITFHVNIDGKDYAQSANIYGFDTDQSDSALVILENLQERYFGQSVTMGQRVYLNAERTQQLDLINSTGADLKGITDLYIDVTVNDGYALFYQNEVVEKDVTEKKYKLVHCFENYYAQYPSLGFEYKEISNTNTYDFEKYYYFGIRNNIDTISFAEIYVNSEKVVGDSFEFQNKGFYVIDYFAEIRHLNPTVFNAFYIYALYQ